MGPYDWLTREGDQLRADVSGCSRAEADRRTVIFQEVASGRLRLPDPDDLAPERLALQTVDEETDRVIAAAEEFEGDGEVPVENLLRWARSIQRVARAALGRG